MWDRRLRIFQMAATMNNFTRAAAALAMTQPNVTGQIRRLEEELGVTLFIRDGRELHLTAAGRALLRETESLLSMTDLVVQRVRAAAGAVRSCRLGATMTAGGYVLPELMARYMAADRTRRFSLRIDNTHEIAEKLKLRQFDLALVEGPFDENFFLSRPLLEDRLLIAGRGRLPSRSIRGLLRSGVPLLLREKGSGTRFAFEQFCRRHDIALEEYPGVLEIAGFDAIKNMIKAGFGITVISELAIREELETGTLCAAEPEESAICRTMNFLYLPDENLKFTEKFITFCRLQLQRQR